MASSLRDQLIAQGLIHPGKKTPGSKRPPRVWVRSQANENAKSVAKFAGELKLPVAPLIQMLRKAGVLVATGEDTLTKQGKAKLLAHLRDEHALRKAAQAECVKVVLTRKRVLLRRSPDVLLAVAPIDFEKLRRLKSVWSTLSAIQRAEVRANLTDREKQFLPPTTKQRYRQHRKSLLTPLASPRASQLPDVPSHEPEAMAGDMTKPNPIAEERRRLQEQLQVLRKRRLIR
jgi:hypothetical protein